MNITTMKNEITTFIRAFFKGYGQIMLQGNLWTGILFLGAVFYDSLLMGAAAVVANAVGMGTARILGFKKMHICQGLFGFNASLYGIALMFYFEPNAWVWAALVLGSAVTAVLMGFALEKKIPVFTFPFILVTWLALYGLTVSGLASKALLEASEILPQMDDLLIEGHAFGQVIFQGSLVAGLIFFIGVFISKPIDALYGFAAVVLSIYLSHHDHQSQEMINNGIFSFNAVLCGIALSGPKVRDGIYVLVAVCISTYFDHFLIHAGWVTLTFPFVVAMWLMTPIKKIDEWLVEKLNP